MKKTLGGDRIGSGKKQQVDLHGYERSTHDLGYIWRSSMAAGTLVPFCSEIALPGDTFDINLDCIVKTHPTIGPLFGSYKVQLDIFFTPLRIYHGKLLTNAIGIGLKMNTIKLPKVILYAAPMPSVRPSDFDTDNCQINPSCLLSYLGIRGVGNTAGQAVIRERSFNAIPILAYWDIYKCYYANKQEEKGAVINTPRTAPTTISSFQIDGNNLTQYPTLSNTPSTNGSLWHIFGVGLTTLTGLKVMTSNTWFTLDENTSAGGISWSQTAPGVWDGVDTTSGAIIQAWDYVSTNDIPLGPPTIELFDLENIDKMREDIMITTSSPGAGIYNINSLLLPPYTSVAIDTPATADDLPYLSTQQGLAIKTYQSDLFNNWLQTDWIDGVGGINEITSVDTSSGDFKIDSLILAKKLYNYLNRVAVSGGTYEDWLDVTYDHERYIRTNTPVYWGGLSKELVFSEVVSNSASASDNEEQPLGTLAGKGVMAQKHKGGKVHIKVDEPGYITGIVSITPRIDYSQGNKWDTHLDTMDDFHKPALDQIGFQELITEQMAWWSTWYNAGTWSTRSAGKQPSWINYMTNVNKTFGNFAIQTNEMFMTLNRRYEEFNLQIKDLTTYIDPVKFNTIFAQTSIDAQNFWVQVGVDMIARRKMSAKIMPSL